MSCVSHLAQPVSAPRAHLSRVAVVFICSLFCTVSLFAQSAVITQAAEKGGALDAVSYLIESIPSIKNKAEQKQVYVFLAHLQQQLGAYTDAYDSFSKAIALDPTTPNTDLRLQAALCALGAGEIALAENALDSVLQITGTSGDGARAKLYAVWCAVMKAQNTADLGRPIFHLTSFLDDPTMNAVKPSVLFTLWWLTGDDKHASALRKNHAGTPEASIVAGLAAVMPAPYLFFVPRMNQGFAVPTEQSQQPQSQTSATAKTPQAATTSGSDGERVKWQQVGLFREEANANRCAQRLIDAGFAPEVLKQSRSGGNTYTAVVVRETDGTVGEKLRNAGFECYPVFE